MTCEKLKNNSRSKRLTFETKNCWVGHCEIGPTEPVPLAGYGGIDRISNTDQKSLEADSFNISNKNYALLIGIDALFSSDAQVKNPQYLKQLGILVGFMWACASHTHFSLS